MQRWSAIVSLILLLSACSRSSQRDKIEIIWRHDKAAAVKVADFHGNVEAVQVRRVGDATQTPILGAVTAGDSGFIFEPAIPFVRGQEYVVLESEKEIAIIKIPLSEVTPDVISVFPRGDVPENLLKIHLQFSTPMREGQSTDKVVMLDAHGNVLRHTFLYMKTELWNKERTSLTLWLDPGRIKRDLIPNKTEGIPLVKGNQYLLHVDSSFEDQSGATLGKNLTFQFLVGERDSLSPDPHRWKISFPRRSTRDPLKLRFGEKLDYSLLEESFHVKGFDRVIEGHWNVVDDEEAIFTPADQWSPGKYEIKIESRVEDLAGNNLNHPFDRAVNQTINPEPEERSLFFDIE